MLFPTHFNPGWHNDCSVAIQSRTCFRQHSFFEICIKSKTRRYTYETIFKRNYHDGGSGCSWLINSGVCRLGHGIWPRRLRLEQHGRSWQWAVATEAICQQMKSNGWMRSSPVFSRQLKGIRKSLYEKELAVKKRTGQRQSGHWSMLQICRRIFRGCKVNLIRKA